MSIDPDRWERIILENSELIGEVRAYGNIFDKAIERGNQTFAIETASGMVPRWLEAVENNISLIRDLSPTAANWFEQKLRTIQEKFQKSKESMDFKTLTNLYNDVVILGEDVLRIIKIIGEVLRRSQR